MTSSVRRIFNILIERLMDDIFAKIKLNKQEKNIGLFTYIPRTNIAGFLHPDCHFEINIIGKSLTLVAFLDLEI